jgi:glycosyltransferase involved in cell wall biosynthesis
MKVMHLVRSLEMGGLEQVVIDLVNGMSRQGIECHVGCLNHGGAWINRAVCAGVWEGHLDERKPWPVVRDLRNYLDDHDITLVNSHNIQPHFFGVFATAGSSRKLVHTKHGRNWIDGSQPRWRRAVWWWKSRQLTRWTDAIIAVSRDAEEVAIQNERVPPAKVRAILNGIDIRRFAPLEGPEESRIATRCRLREKLGLPEDAFIIGSVGRLSPEKNYPMLVRAFAEFKKEVPGALLVLVGDGESQAAIEAEISRAGLGDAVHLAGRQAVVTDWLHALDLFCLSSFSEGTSIALLEAGACGLPALVTDVGGNAEIVRHGVSGWVVPSRDEHQYALALGELWKRRAEFERWGSEARVRVVQHYSLDAMVDAYLKVYRNVLADRPPFEQGLSPREP